MITKNDCILLLTDIEEQCADADKTLIKQYLKDTINSNTINIDVLKFINKARPLDLTQFYTKIRKSYNKGHSSLYINIVKEIDDVNEVLITLSALQTQILLFAKDMENREMFLRHARISEIETVLLNYYQTHDLTNCLNLIHLIKADIKALESMTDRSTKK